MRSLVRFWLAATATFVVWLVAAPALAAAPQCDERGAITFAPNPKLEEPVSSLDVPECPASVDGNLGYEPTTHGGEIDLDFSMFPATLPEQVAILPSSFLATHDALVDERLAEHAWRGRLERPPR